MELLSDVFHKVYECAYIRHIVAGGVVAVVGWRVYKLVTKRRVDLSRYPHDKVTLVQIPRGPFAPSLSPFPMKLETYLRMANIPYQSEESRVMSSKSKTPWMVYEGQEIADSQICIEFLNQARGVDLSSHLSDSERAIAEAFRTTAEDHVYWPVALYRWTLSLDDSPEGRDFLLKDVGIPASLVRYFGRHIQNQANGQGTGRHTREEAEHMAMKALRNLSTFLGDKPFLMGDLPCEQDCCIFGFLAQAYWHLPGSPYEKLVKEECSNLGEYCLRMKEKYWPDWDECLKKTK